MKAFFWPLRHIYLLAWVVCVYLELLKTSDYILVFADSKRKVVLSFSSLNTFLVFAVLSLKYCLSANIWLDFPDCLLLITPVSTFQTCPHRCFRFISRIQTCHHVCSLLFRLQYSLCNEPLIELSNPGASGSIFYVSSDDEFIIKTVQHKEAEFLQKLLPGYFMVNN